MERVQYKKPTAFNMISLLLVLVIGLAGYLLVYLWPVFNESSRVKSILLEFIPKLYRANLLPSETGIPMIEEMKEEISISLEKAGLNPKAVKIIVARSPKEISIEARFKTKAKFPFPDRTFEFEVSPKAVSDATRIDW